jgi:hypothetical protein
MSGTLARHRSRLVVYLALVGTLGVIAVFASRLRLPDSFFYTQASEQMIHTGCAEIHCFRVLVPWTIGALPGPALLRWKGYGVVCNAATALTVFDLCLLLGLSRRASLISGGLSVFGFGSLYTLFEPYTSDPLMFCLTPLLTRWALEDRILRAGVAASIGVFAKEFIVVPLAIVGTAEARAGEWRKAFRLAAAAGAAFVVWLGLGYVLRSRFGYSYGTNKSPHLLAGSYLSIWLSHMSARGALSAMFNEFGATYLLIPLGWLAAPARLRQLVIAALPLAVVFSYVQQPDRALWNFHFLTSPLAALALEPMTDAYVCGFLAVYAFANLKVGAQIDFVPQARYAFAAGLILAGIAAVRFMTSRRLRVRPATT